MLGSWVLAAVQENEAAERLSPGRQNPILREYFRRQYMELHSPPNHQVPPPFLDSFIDLQIDHFLSSVEEKLGRLQSSAGTLEQARTRWIEAPVEQHRELSALFKQTLRAIEAEAGDLRKTLSLIFVELKSKSSAEPNVQSEPEARFDNEVRFISATLSLADKRIRDYLFSTNSTVHVGDLRDKNMLVLLHEVRVVARRVQKRL